MDEQFFFFLGFVAHVGLKMQLFFIHSVLFGTIISFYGLNYQQTHFIAALFHIYGCVKTSTQQEWAFPVALFYSAVLAENLE